MSNSLFRSQSLNLQSFLMGRTRKSQRRWLHLRILLPIPKMGGKITGASES